MPEAGVPRTHSQSVKILFLGQCHQYGYKEVHPELTYVSLAISSLRTQFPHLKLRLDKKHLFHPKGLKAILKHRLPISRPDITVITVAGVFTSQARRVNMLYEIAPEVVDTARSFVQKVEAKLHGSDISSSTSIDGFLAWHPPLEVSEYERIVREGVELCRKGGSRPVLAGPSYFNEDASEDLFSVKVPNLAWKSAEEMTRRVAKSMNVALIDSCDSLVGHGIDVFLPQNIRWSRFGHQLIARETERVLASEIAALQAVEAVESLQLI